MKNCFHYLGHLFLAAYFVLFLTIGDLGFWLCARVYSCIIKDEISEAIQENECRDSVDVITVANAARADQDLSWTQQDKEFSYCGEMYDIIKASTSGDSTKYFCIKDTKETRLRYSVDQHVKNENAPPSAVHNYNLKVVKDFRKSTVGNLSHHDTWSYAEWNIRHHDDPEVDPRTPPPKSC